MSLTRNESGAVWLRFVPRTEAQAAVIREYRLRGVVKPYGCYFGYVADVDKLLADLKNVL